MTGELVGAPDLTKASETLLELAVYSDVPTWFVDKLHDTLPVIEAAARAEAPRLTERLERLVTDWESDGGLNPWSNDGWDKKEVQRECAAELRAALAPDAPAEGT